MKTNSKFLVYEDVPNRLFETGSFAYFLARGCFGAIVLGSVLFAGSVAARKTDKSNDLKVFFPQRPLPASREEAYKTPLSRDIGQLVLKMVV